jgi:hypothetical protein
MYAMRGLILTVALLGASGGEAVAGPPDPEDTTTLMELVVTPQAKCLPARNGASAARRPRVLGTYPARGAVVRPGRLVLRVTFDRPMTCSGFILQDPPAPSPCAPSRQEMVLSFNRRTVRLVCQTAPNTGYAVRIGDWENEAFISLDGGRAEPYALAFTTSSGPAVATIAEALAQDSPAAR